MSDSEIWSVALAANNIQSMTLDQLDEAFQRGEITEDTLIWTEGMDNWQRLAEVLGEDEPEEPAAPVAAPVVAAAPAAAAPVAQSFAPQAQAFSPQAAQSFPPQAAQSFAPQPMAAAQAAPGVAAAQAQYAQQGAAPQPSMPPHSLAPTTSSPMDIGIGTGMDLDEFPKKKGKWGLIAAAAVVIAGAGFTAVNLSGSSEMDPSGAAAAAKPLPAGEQPIVNAKDPDAPLDVGGGYQITAAEEKKFKQEETRNSELREKMAAALQKPDEEPAKPAARRSSGARRSSKASSSSKSSPIKKGGAQYDPLNGALP